MPKYLSARRLGITTAEHRALVLLSQILGATPNLSSSRHAFDPGLDEVRGTFFDMNYCASGTSCGTVACIGGHVSLVIQGVDMVEAEFPVTTRKQRRIAENYVDDFGLHDGIKLTSSLAALYYPDGRILQHAEAGEAILAIKNYLTTGDPQWHSVVNDRFTREHLWT